MIREDQQLTRQQRSHDAPSTPPAAPGAYKKKCEEGGEVIAMIDSVITELDMEMTEAETEEKLAQEEYKELIATEEYVNQLHAEYKWIVQ